MVAPGYHVGREEAEVRTDALEEVRTTARRDGRSEEARASMAVKNMTYQALDIPGTTIGEPHLRGGRPRAYQAEGTGTGKN